MILQQGEEADGLGLHLSGGVPPVSVVYVSPGGQAEQAGVKIGDIVLEVNGLNCQKKVEIAKLKKMKMIVQELPMENPDEQDVSSYMDIANLRRLALSMFYMEQSCVYLYKGIIHDNI